MTPYELGNLVYHEILSYEPDPEYTDLLLRYGADINQLYGSGVTLLHVATEKGNLRVIKKLVECGADPNALEHQGRPSLHLATLHDKLDVLRGLLECGAQINSKDSNGWSALHIAVQCEHLRMIHELLNRGADIYILNNDEETPWDIASSDIRRRIPRLNPKHHD